MKLKSLLKFVPAVAMLLAAGLTASAAISAPVAMSVAPAKILQKSAVRPLDVQDGQTIFSYAPGGCVYVFGSKKAGSYDAAIKLDGKAFAGAKVTGVRFQIFDDRYTTNVSGWTSQALTGDPDGEVVPVEDVQAAASYDDYTEVRFTTPVEVPADGLYCGYSLTITRVVANIQGTTHPLAAGDDDSVVENGFFLRNETLTEGVWEDYSANPALAMQVILTGVASQGVDIALDEYIIAKPGETSSCNLTVVNNTGKSVSSIEYSYSIAGKTSQSGTGSKSVTLSSILGASATEAIDLPAVSEAGEYDLTVKVTKVNGEENTGDNIEATTKFVVTNLDIKHRAVVEEYTGAWCSACPRGYIGMKRMSEKYPEDFIGLAYHASQSPYYNFDVMEATNVVFPSNVSSFPSCWLDRVGDYIDPYFGTGNEEMGIEQDWLARCEEPAPAAIEVEAALSDDLETVSVTSRTAFALSGVEGFKVAYALLADGLTGEGNEWKQVNGYAGNQSALPGDDWDMFFKGGSRVAVEFNDVVILAPDSRGVENSIPSDITVGKWNEHNYTFTLSEATSYHYDVSLVQKLWKLRVVAMLVNAEGEIVNAAKCNVSTPAGVNGVESSMDEPVEVARYSLDGRLLSEPERGVNLVKMSDGTVRKVIVK